MIPYSTPKLSDFYSWFSHDAGLKIATDTVANATKISSLMTKNSGSVATLATRFLYDLDTNTFKQNTWAFILKQRGQIAISNGQSFLTGSKQNQIGCCFGRSRSVADRKNQNQNSASKLHASCFLLPSTLLLRNNEMIVLFVALQTWRLGNDGHGFILC